MFRSIWFWVVVILAGAALWFGQDQIASYFDKLPMTAQERTTNTQQLATTTPRPISSATVRPTVAPISTVNLTAMPPAPTRPPAATPASSFTTYVVKKGDTLYSISKKYNTSVETLQRLNGITDPSTLYVGQELKAPKPPAAKIATRPALKSGAKYYKVQKGDTLSGIARKFSTSTATLQKLNNFANPNKLVVGAVILVPATSPATPKPTTRPAAPANDDALVHSMPVTASPAAETKATALSTGPTATPTPSPIPTMPSVCDGAQEAVFVWGVSFCVPPGWNLQEYAQPYHTALLSKNEESGELSIYAISRMDGSPNAPLSWSMRQAKKSVSTEISSIIPGGLAEPASWSLATGVSIGDVEGQVSEAQSTYLKTGRPAHVRVIVFNHGDQRWRIVIVAPETLWQSYNVSVYPYLLRTMEVF